MKLSRCSPSLTLWDDLALTWFEPWEQDTGAWFILSKMKKGEKGCRVKSWPGGVGGGVQSVCAVFSLCLYGFALLGSPHSPKMCMWGKVCPLMVACLCTSFNTLFAPCRTTQVFIMDRWMDALYTVLFCCTFKIVVCESLTLSCQPLDGTIHLSGSQKWTLTL